MFLLLDGGGGLAKYLSGGPADQARGRHGVIIALNRIGVGIDGLVVLLRRFEASTRRTAER